MSKVWYLVKVQLLSTGGINKMLHEHDANKKRKMLGMAVGFLLIGILCLCMSIVYNGALLINLVQWKMETLYLPLVMTLTSLFLFITTIYKVSGTLFGVKDYDTLMALPIPTSYIVASRMIWLYSMNFLFLCVIMLPAGVLYSVMVEGSLIFWVKYIISLICVPLIPIIAGAVIGTIITAIASRFRHTSIVSIIISMLVVVAIFAATGTIGQVSENLLEHVDLLGEMMQSFIQKVYPLALVYGVGVCGNNIGRFLSFIGLSLGSFILFAILLGSKYKTIQTGLMSASAHRVYRLGELKGKSSLMGLYQKEIRRYISSTLYVMNTAIGGVMLLVAAVGLCVVDISQLESMLGIPNVDIYLGQFAPLAMSLFMILTCTTASAISLEGKNLWILKSLPIKIEEIFISKILVQLTVTLPAVLMSGIIIIVVFQLNLIQSVLIFVLPSAYSILMGIMGLIINIKYPRLDWTSEVQVIKQGAATMIAMVIGLLSLVIPSIIIILIPGLHQDMKLVLSTLVVVVMIVVSYKHLTTKGVEQFKILE
ncbi:MAG: hypothetical protein RR090_04840 [Niameybacter sp.]|uniref:hypothetical protein n=1 Tax=Niameybacter sp. TaxID=2033640 RepID=UPI002FCAA629